MVACDYCKRPAELVTGREIYPRRPDLFRLHFWRCEPCGAYVGCHKAEGGNGDGTKPLGRLANAELRAAKIRAHAAFDPLWRERGMKRHKAYGWLAERLGIQKSECHIGMMDVAMCERVVDACVEATKPDAIAAWNRRTTLRQPCFDPPDCETIPYQDRRGV